MTRLREYVPMRLIAAALVLFLFVQGYQWISRTGDITITASFTNANGLYQGDAVKVLGVTVGTITGVQPESSDVRVMMRISAGYKIPAGADAAIVSPSLVSGEYVQLAPAYSAGPIMRGGASISLDRTAVPLSFDDVKTQLTQLSNALAPGGAGSQPLRDAINAMEVSLRHGNADALRTAIQGLENTATSLADGRGDLFSTVASLNSFTQNLAINDAAVAGFTTQLASVSSVLAANRRELTQAVASMAQALGTTGSLLRINRSRINTSIKSLTLLSAALADRSNEFAGIVHVAPTALMDLYNTVDHQAITAQQSLTGLDDPAAFVCSTILGIGGTAQECRSALSGLLRLRAVLQAVSKTRVGVAGLTDLLGPRGLTGSLKGLTSLLPGLLGTALGGV